MNKRLVRSVPLRPDPLWYKDAVIYEVHVRSFFDSNGDGNGDFRGLKLKLDYLQSLGVTCLWLLPFYPSPLRDDGYDISDYYGVNPIYGTRRDFQSFVREAHRRGIRVITELVVNHTSDCHPWFQEARASKPGSAARNFYVWNESDDKYKDARIIFTDTEKSNWTFDAAANAYYWHRFFHHQPDLNFDNPQVNQAILKVMRHWLNMGVDGMRLDAVPYLIERDGTNCENLPETHEILRQWRRRMDAEYRGRMLLAEANQWPADVRQYFGDGDECHMAFHFPLMPRIFMAIRQEDRHPITEILKRTPDIPDSCQWALFLRNHDEMTLEMVTDQERDYMYSQYAADPRMRINVGIRRRLAPLLEHSRRRIELLNSLLFSFPGTPIIYYGDEIGMGDNVYLGDRNGVRTPMQWSGDTNAGFSHADFARLYSPPIMDSIYGYQAVNVESQERDPSSLLSWMKRIIALRNRHKTFGRGTMEFLYPQNRKILAYVRRYEGHVVLAVANLSRYVQPVELDLSQFAGLTPIEMMGQTEFPPVGDSPYFLSLGPHSFYWFQMQAAREQIAVLPAAGPQPARAGILAVRCKWADLLKGASRSAIERDILPAFLRNQRWFSAAGPAIRAVRFSDVSEPILTSAPSFLTLVETEFSDGSVETYFLALRISSGNAAGAAREYFQGDILTNMNGPEGDAVLYEAFADDEFCAEMLTAIRDGLSWRAKPGTFDAFPAGLGPIDLPAPLKMQRGAGDAKNTRISCGGSYVLKVFRLVSPGPNPDYEITRFLNEKTDFDRTPGIAGAVERRAPGSDPATLVVLQRAIVNQGDGMRHAVDDVTRYFERAAAQGHRLDKTGGVPKSPLDLIGRNPPGVVRDLIGAFLEECVSLGRRAAQLHLAMASDKGDAAFAPEPVTNADIQRWTKRLKKSAADSADLLRKKPAATRKNIMPDAARILKDMPRRADRAAAAIKAGPTPDKIRIHGDFRLSQTLSVENDFAFIDFEGDPGRPVEERRAKDSPIKDVARMVRSFSHAAYDGAFAFIVNRQENLQRIDPWAKIWQGWTTASFLDMYLRTARGAVFLPADPDRFRFLLNYFLLVQSLDDLAIDLAHRPDRARITFEFIRSVLDRIPE